MGKSRVYQIYQKRDSLKEALTNIELIRTKEEKLSVALINSQFPDDFKDLLDGIKDNKKHYESQITSLNTTLKSANELIAVREDPKNDRDFIDNIISLTIEALGLTEFEKEEK